MDQKRRGATYGKASRKITSLLQPSAFDDFAQIQQSKISTAPSSHLPAKTYIAEKGASTVLSREGKSLMARPQKQVLKNGQDPAPKSADDLGIFDFTSSGDEGDETVQDAGVPSRKRRKITPKSTIPQDSAVYDEQSLPQTTTTNISTEPDLVLSTTDTDVESTSTISKGGNKRSNDSEDAGDRETKRKPSSVQKNVRGGKIGPGTSGPRKAMPQSVQSARLTKSPSSIVGPSRMQMSPPKSRPHVQVSDPKKNFWDTSTKEAKKNSHKKSPVVPETREMTTPPRKMGTGSAASTPKQRELWNKLLPDEESIASPSYLQVSKLQLDEHIVKSGSVNRGTRQSWSTNTEKPLRSFRIIDSLDANKGGLTTGEDLCSDDDNDGDDATQLQSNADETVLVDGQDIQSQHGSQRGGEKEDNDQSSTLGQAAPLAIGSSLKNTYARQRSYLSENNAVDAALFGLPSVPEAAERQQPVDGASRKARSNTLSQHDDFASIEEIPDTQNGTMRSIHELREAGGNRRVLLDLEANLDDIDHQQGSNHAIRRSSLISLASKLLDRGNCRLFIDHGFDSRLLPHMTYSQDTIENSLLVSLLLLILFHGSYGARLESESHAQTVKTFLQRTLHSSDDLIKTSKLRETKMSKLAQREFENLCQSFLKSPAWHFHKPSKLSNQILSLQCFEYIVRQSREAGFVGKVLSSEMTQEIVEISFPESVPSSQSQAQLDSNVELALSTLESSTVGGAVHDAEMDWSDQTHARIRELLPALLAKPPDATSSNAQLLMLRLFLNLTNGNSALCEIYGQPHAIESLLQCVILQFERIANPQVEDLGFDPRDSLLLSLGCLINFADSSEPVRKSMLTFQGRKAKYLDILLQLFVKDRRRAAEASTEEHADFVVAYGYLSVLLSYLCIDETSRAQLGDRLRALGGDFKELLASTDKFLLYHRQIDDHVRAGNEVDDRRTSFVTHSQAILNDWRRAN